jgi:hypothetical protein
VVLIYAQEVLQGRRGQNQPGVQEPRAHGPISIVSDLKNVTKRVQPQAVSVGKIRTCHFRPSRFHYKPSQEN